MAGYAPATPPTSRISRYLAWAVTAALVDIGLVAIDPVRGACRTLTPSWISDHRIPRLISRKRSLVFACCHRAFRFGLW